MWSVTARRLRRLRLVAKAPAFVISVAARSSVALRSAAVFAAKARAVTFGRTLVDSTAVSAAAVSSATGAAVAAERLAAVVEAFEAAVAEAVVSTLLLAATVDAAVVGLAASEVAFSVGFAASEAGFAASGFAVSVACLSVVSAAALSVEASGVKLNVDAVASVEDTAAVGSAWAVDAVDVSTRSDELSPSTDEPGFDEEASGAMTSSACAVWAAKSAVPSKTEATPNEYLRNENRWRLLKMSFISSLPLYEIVSYRSRVYKNPILELMILLHSNILTIYGQVIKSTFLKKIKLSDNSANNFCLFFAFTSVKPLILFALYRFQISILFSFHS